MDGLEEFEKALAAEKTERERSEEDRHGDRERKHRHHHKSRHHSSREDGEERDGHRHKRSRHSRDGEEEDRGRNRRHSKTSDPKEMEEEEAASPPLRRDSWMTEPSALDIDYTQRGAKKVEKPVTNKRPDYDLKVHDNELNHHLRDLVNGKKLDEITDESAKHEISYTFGDSGAQWRMTKLKAVYTQAEQSGRSVDEVAMERFGDLREFDDLREEQIELDRRQLYGEGYVRKERPSGELFQERKLELGIRRSHDNPHKDSDLNIPQGTIVKEEQAPATSKLDQTALNRLKARLMKAKLKKSPDVAKLEAEYENSMADFVNTAQPDVVVLGQMENRMLAGTRGEVKSIDNKRGRERGLVEENEDMSIEDMVREERRTKGLAGGESLRFAERIAKDAKFDNDLDYIDDNANKLAKRVQKSEVNLKNTAISEFQKMNRILDNCKSSWGQVFPLWSGFAEVYLPILTV